MTNFDYKVDVQSQASKARLGTISTPHGDIRTPAFVTVGTKATVKSLSPDDLKKTGTQFLFGNTYHLVLSPGPDIIAEHGGIHAMSGINKPMITDSGGFQVFSLALQGNQYEHKRNSHQHHIPTPRGACKPYLVKITDDGVAFRSHIDGTKYMFTPEYSIEAQQKIGADFIVAFDECIYNGATKKYTKAATDRTHAWAQRSLKAAATTCSQQGSQRMYGVIQGGMFKDLRQYSTQAIAEMPFFGIALGGVSVGETNEELREEISWVMDALHGDPRPRHLLGISTFEDVIYAVKHGLDTFDCVLPTRDARTGKLYVKTGTDEHGIGIYRTIKITHSEWKSKVKPVNPQTLGGTTYAYLHHLFKQRELLAYRLATIHNLTLMEQFFAEIREAIEGGKL